MEKVLIYFTTYSVDNYYMVTSKDEVKKMSAEEFCKEFLPEEYECWDGKFKYGRFSEWKINENGSCNIKYKPCIGHSSFFPIREMDIIDTTKMEEDKLYSSDEMRSVGGYIDCGVPY